MSTAAASRGRIVVGVDGSAPSDAALAWAVEEAVIRGAEVVAVHALGVGPVVAALPQDGEAGPGRFEAAARHLLQEALGRTAARERVPTRTRVPEGPPVAALVAESADADVLVLGTRGHGGLPGLVLGSTGYGCLHACRCPVVLLRGPDTAGTPGGPIVVGVDGTPGSIEALTWALAEADRREAKVQAVLAWQDPYTLIGPPPPTWVAGESVDRLEKVLAQSVEQTVQAVGAEVAVAREVRSGRPVDVLTDAARGAALLVVGSRGRSPVRAAVLGSVSQRCVQSASAPVVVVNREDAAHQA